MRTHDDFIIARTFSFIPEHLERCNRTRARLLLFPATRARHDTTLQLQATCREVGSRDNQGLQSDIIGRLDASMRPLKGSDASDTHRSETLLLRLVQNRCPSGRGGAANRLGARSSLSRGPGHSYSATWPSVRGFDLSPLFPAPEAQHVTPERLNRMRFRLHPGPAARPG